MKISEITEFLENAYEVLNQKYLHKSIFEEIENDN